VPANAWIPLLTTQVCLLFSLTLWRDALRKRRPYLVSWGIALACFTVGAFALWYGTAFGWSGASFRAYYLFGALLGVPWLGLGQLQLLTGPRVWGTVLGVVVLLSLFAGPVLAEVPFVADQGVHGFGLPDGHLLFGPVARALVAVGNAGGTLLLVAGVVLSVWRLHTASNAAARARRDGVVLVLIGAVVAGSGGVLAFLGDAAAHGLAVLIGVSLIAAGHVVTGRVRVGRHRGVGRHAAPAAGAAGLAGEA
jgi:hypothetical protein